MYDHQIALDPDAQVLYVHGGRVVDGDWQTAKYSGLYSYDLRSGKWSMLQYVYQLLLVNNANALLEQT